MALVLRVDRAVYTGGSAIYNTDETGCNQTCDAGNRLRPAPATTPAAEFIDACDATTAATGSGTGSTDSEKYLPF